MPQLDQKAVLFEQTAIPRAVAQLAIPTILSSLVMVIYNLADTYFVGNAERSGAKCRCYAGAPVLLRFQCNQQPFRRGQFQHDEPCARAEKTMKRFHAVLHLVFTAHCSAEFSSLPFALCFAHLFSFCWAQMK